MQRARVFFSSASLPAPNLLLLSHASLTLASDHRPSLPPSLTPHFHRAVPLAIPSPSPRRTAQTTRAFRKHTMTPRASTYIANNGARHILKTSLLCGTFAAFFSCSLSLGHAIVSFLFTYSSRNPLPAFGIFFSLNLSVLGDPLCRTYRFILSLINAIYPYTADLTFYC
jgi:hypothetical protein